MFGKIKDTLDKGVAAVSVKSESLVESSRVKTAMSNSQKKLDAEFTVLGSKFYKACRDGLVPTGPFGEELARISEIEREIDSLVRRLEEIREEESRILGSQRTAGVFCTNCGKSLDPGSRFCDACGTPVGR